MALERLAPPLAAQLRAGDLAQLAVDALDQRVHAPSSPPARQARSSCGEVARRRRRALDFAGHPISLTKSHASDGSRRTYRPLVSSTSAK